MPRRNAPKLMYLVWTRHGRKYYARAANGLDACLYVDAHMAAHGIHGDRSVNAFLWEDQTVFPVRITPSKAGVR